MKRLLKQNSWTVHLSVLVIYTFVLCANTSSAQPISDKYLESDPPGRKALVISNSDYEFHEPLPAAGNDGTRIAKLLEEKLGFDVTFVEDIKDSKKLINKVIKPFAITLEEDDIVIVYYSGHGYSLNGFSYIAPTELEKVLTQNDAATKGYPIANLYDEVKSFEAGYVLTIFDACRTMARIKLPDGEKYLISKGGTSVNNKAPSEANFSIHFATSLGLSAPAEGGPDGLSPFTKHLLKTIGLDGEYDDVVKATNASLRDNNIEIGSVWEMRSEIDLLLNDSPDIQKKYREKWLQQFNPSLSSSEQRKRVANFARREKLNPFVKAARQWLDDHPPASVAEFWLPNHDPESDHIAMLATSGWTALSPVSVNAIWEKQQSTGNRFAMPFPQANLMFPRAVSAQMANNVRFDWAKAFSAPIGATMDPTTPAEVASGYAQMLKENGLVVTANRLNLRAAPGTNAAILATVDESTPLVVKDVVEVSGNWWVSATVLGREDFNENQPIYASVGVHDTDRTAVLGQNLAEKFVPVSQVMPGIVDSSVIDKAIHYLKDLNFTITHVLVVGDIIPTTDPRQELLKNRQESLLLNAGYHLTKHGVPGSRISYLTETKKLDSPGVLLRIFGY